jgi:DNA-binding MarR family transcriptional regulator
MPSPIAQYADDQYAGQYRFGLETSVREIHEMPGHLARRFQQIAVAVFLAEVEGAGFDITPVQYAALAAVGANPEIDQVTLAGLIAFDRTTITGVVDRLVLK